MKSVDTHMHLWDLDRYSYSWCGTIPTLNRSFGMKEYIEAARGSEMAKCVFVEGDVDESYMLDETRCILSLAEQDNPLEGVVACGRPEKPDFEKFLDQIAGHRKLKGIRRVMHTQPDNLAETRIFVENIRLLEQYGLSFDICVLDRQLRVAVNLVKECPGVSFILDHCGAPQVKEQVLDPWRKQIEDISKCPNIVCKISGLIGYADPENWTPEDLRPYIEHVIRCFGWDRVMFGSDWPVCTLSASFQAWVEALCFLTRHVEESNRHKLFCGNAERIYRLN
jgi:predicted TIM-barrel fold metal-dependent hydrolase